MKTLDAKPFTKRKWLTAGLAAALLMSVIGVAHTAEIVWTNTAGGNWNVAVNWSPNQVPSAADHAVITNAGIYTVNLDVNVIVASLVLGAESGQQTLTNFNRTITLDGTSQIRTNAALSMTGSSIIAGNGHLTIAGSLIWNAGSLNGNVTVASSGQVDLDGTVTVFLRGELTNFGTITWAQSGSGLVRLTAGGSLFNAPGGVIEIQSDHSMDSISIGGTEYFLNDGLLRKSGATGLTTIDVAFTNTGTVEVQSGLLRFSSGGWLDGSFEAAAGAAVEFSTGTWSLQPGAGFLGDGVIRQTGGTMSYVNAAMKDLVKLELVGGALTADGPITNLTVSGGTLDGNGSLSGLINFSSGKLLGDKRLDGILNWTAGSLNGTLTVANQGAVNLNGTVAAYIRGALTNFGTITWAQSGSGLVRLTAGGSLLNALGGVIEIQSDRSMDNITGNGTESFLNAGLVRKSGATGQTTVDAHFTNTGTVEVQSGSLRFSSGG